MRLVLALLLGGAMHAAAQERPAAESDVRARIIGTVLIEGPDRPLATAQVELLVQGAYALTDSAGRFELASVTPGWDTLQVSLLEFESEKIPVFVQPGGLHPVELVVPYPFAQLEDLTVRLYGRPAERMLGYERRRAGRRGRFITREEIQRRRPVLLSQMFRSVPWTRVAPDGRVLLAGRNAVSSLRRRRVSTLGRTFSVGRVGGAGRLQCSPTIFVDGVRRDTRLTQIDDIDPRRIAGIEIYRAPFIPFRFRDHRRPGMGCGSIVVWTTWGMGRS